MKLHFSLFFSFCIDSIRLPFSGMVNFPTQGRNMFYNHSEKGLLTLGQASLTSLLASWTSWDDKLRQKISCSCSASENGYGSSNVAHSGKMHWTRK